MKTLLLYLSWFLLGLSIALSVAVIMTMLLRKKNPEVAIWTSWISLILSCIAVVSVILTTGYISMRMKFSDDDEVLCAAFGLKPIPHVTLNMTEYHLKFSVNDSLLAASTLWMAFTDNFPQAEKWSRWIAVGLCMGAAVSFAIVLKFITMKNERRQIRRKKNIALANNLMRKSPHTGCKKMESQISFIYKDKLVGRKPCAEKPKLLICDVWAVYAALGVFCATLIGVIILNHYVDWRQEEALLQKCVTFDYVPLALASGEETSKIKVTDKPKFHGYPLHIISRDEWKARSPKDSRPLKLPVDQVVVSYTVSGSCFFLDDCIRAIRHIQEYNMGPRNGLWDISSNFLIARDGRVYEGRGWSSTPDNTGLSDNGSLGVLFSGSTRHLLPPVHQMKAFKTLIDEGQRIGNIAKDYTLVVHPKSRRYFLNRILK